MRRSLPVSLFPVLVATAAAQMQDTNLVVGWTNAPLLPASGHVDLQDVDGQCRAAKRLCSAVLLHNALAHAGGTAYDPRHGSVWVSDGRLMEERAVGDCRVICTVKPSLMNEKAILTGLAMVDVRRELFHLESTPGYLGILPWDNARCPPRPVKGGCTMTLAPGEIAAGLAYDEARSVFYYTTSLPGASGWTNRLHVAPASGNRCRPACSFTLPSCSSAPVPVTGLAYDTCSKRLYVAEGRNIRVLEVLDALECRFKDLGCCAKQWGAAWGGLAVIPGWRQRRIGGSCLAEGCPKCASMLARPVGGDPSLGNRDFALQLENGPAERFAFLVLGGGPCTRGLILPFVCHAVHPRLPEALVLPPIRITGKGTCQGTALVPLPLPPDAGLCGLQLCAQWIVICGGPVLGSTEALEFSIAGS